LALVVPLSMFSRASNSNRLVFLLLPKFVPMNPDTIQLRRLSDDVCPTG
jgi:hypothetical protein